MGLGTHGWGAGALSVGVEREAIARVESGRLECCPERVSGPQAASGAISHAVVRSRRFMDAESTIPAKSFRA